MVPASISDADIPTKQLAGATGATMRASRVKSILELIVELERLDNERTIERFKLTTDRNLCVANC